MKIPLETIKDSGDCSPSMDKIRDLYPDGIPLDVPGLVAAARTLRVVSSSPERWAIYHLLTDGELKRLFRTLTSDWDDSDLWSIAEAFVRVYKGPVVSDGLDPAVDILEILGYGPTPAWAASSGTRTPGAILQ